MKLGRPEFDAENAWLTERLNSRGILIAAHRGVHSGVIIENTVEAALAAIASGADTVECDILRSADGEYFIFHDGYEQHWLGLEPGRNLGSLSAAEIKELTYLLHPLNNRPRKVDTAVEFFTRLADKNLTIDRSERYWKDGFLDFLAEHRAAELTLIKCMVTEENLRLLGEQDKKFPVMPIVFSMEEIDQVLAAPGINCVGFEILCSDPEHEFATKEFFADMRERGLIVLVNCQTLEDGRVLYLGWDDYASITQGPDAGWKKCGEIGATMIHTDFPWLVRDALGLPRS